MAEPQQRVKFCVQGNVMEVVESLRIPCNILRSIHPSNVESLNSSVDDISNALNRAYIVSCGTVFKGREEDVIKAGERFL